MRFLVAFLLSLALVCVFPVAAHGGPSTFAWSVISNVQIDQPVEQQTPWIDDGGPGQPWWPNDRSLWVTNPTGCAWDVDDHWQVFADGALTAASYPFCFVVETPSVHNTLWGQEGWWSFAPRALAVSVRSSSPSLTVKACFSPGACTTFPPQQEKRSYNYHGCVRLTTQNASEIAGSNGGLGEITQGTLTASSAKRVSATGTAEIAGGFGDWSAYC